MNDQGERPTPSLRTYLIDTVRSHLSKINKIISLAPLIKTLISTFSSTPYKINQGPTKMCIFVWTLQ